MGKRAQDAASDVTFQPIANNNENPGEINVNLPLPRLTSPVLLASVTDSNRIRVDAATPTDHGVPNFMRDTLSKTIYKNPELLAFIRPKQKGKKIRGTTIMPMALVAHNTPPKLGTDPQITTPRLNGTDNSPDCDVSSPRVLQTTVSASESDDSHTRPSKIGLVTRSTTVNPGDLDKDTFTFKPKMSAASARIVDQLGSDFMSRQQKHLEKQKKLVQQAASQYRSHVFGQISPLPATDKLKVKVKTNGKALEEGISSSVDGDLVDCDVTVRDPTLNLSNQNEGMIPGVDVMKSSSVGSLSKSEPTGIKHLLGPSKTNLSLKRSTSKLSRRHRSIPPETQHNGEMTHSLDESQVDITGSPTHISHSRSKTMPTQMTHKGTKKLAALNLERIRVAREQADKAIKNKKIFVIQGPYPRIRESLRQRGWVERFLKMQGPAKKSPRKKKKGGGGEEGGSNTDSDDSDDDDADPDVDMGYSENAEPPWEEENGVYGIMSRIVRHCPPAFIWSVRRDVIDYKYLKREQIVNHYAKAGSFTTKVGLCVNLRNVPWFDQCDPESFFPRCYRLSQDEEKQSFIDDYRLTACINVLKWVQEKSHEPPPSTTPEVSASNPKPKEKSKPEKKKDSETKKTSEEEKKADLSVSSSISPRKSPLPLNRRSQAPSQKKGGHVPPMVLDLAIQQCLKFLRYKDHDDIDEPEDEHEMTEIQWDQFIQWYYQLVHDGASIPHIKDRLTQVDDILNQVKVRWPQYELDGTRNVWIVKPGAKSRGRGIMCYDRIEDMLKLVSSTVVKKEGKYVVQKYMERPLLIHNTKFDIRQWFLVTDWNPLTLYFYKDSYLRFCSQQYTLEDFNEAIHLSNNAIQKNYSNGPRSDQLPKENMWSSDEFKDFLRGRGCEKVWDEQIYPGMKKAVTCALLSAQDNVEYRKSAFELYGADFMLTEDYQPWLIEINCSPSMSYSTKITHRMCADVLEDSLKVVLDRRWDRNCDIGHFELSYKQPYVSVPPYIGIDLTVSGSAVKKPGIVIRRLSEQAQTLINKHEKPESMPTPRTTHHHTTENTMSAPAKIGGTTSTSTTKPTASGATSSSSAKPISIAQPTLPKSQHAQNPTAKNKMGITPLPPPPLKFKMNKDKVLVRRDTTHHSVIPKTENTLERTSRQALYQKSMRYNSINSTSIESEEIPVPEKNVLPLRNVEAPELDLTQEGELRGQAVTNPGNWSNICTHCGNGMNLKLDITSPVPCKCQQDSIMMNVGGQRSRSAGGSTPGSKPQTPNSRTPTPHHEPIQLSEVLTPLHKLHIERNKLLASVYTKTQAETNRYRYVLKYTDGGIKRPKTPKQVLPATVKGFPKLMARYVSKKQQRDELMIAVDSYRHPGQNVSVISHSFCN